MIFSRPNHSFLRCSCRYGHRYLARVLLSLAILTTCWPGTPQAAEDQWSEQSLGFLEIIAVQGRNSLGVILEGRNDSMPNPASCPIDLRSGTHEAPGSWAQNRLTFNAIYLDLPLEAETADQELQTRLLTKALFAAHMSRSRIFALVDGTACSKNGRPIIKGLRINNLLKTKTENGER